MPPRLARRRARSPVGERATVELAVDGALLLSPRVCARLASRTVDGRAPLCRTPGEGWRGSVPHGDGGALGTRRL